MTDDRASPATEPESTAGVRVRRTLRSLAQRAHGYARVIGWLAIDGTRQAKLQTGWIVLSSSLGVAAFASAIGVVLACAKSLEKNSPAHLLYFSVEDNPSAAVVLCSGVFLVLALFGALAKYYSCRTARRVARQYEVFCAGRLLNILSRCIDFPATDDGSPANVLSLRRLALSGARACGLAHGVLLDSVIPFVTFAVAAVALFWINPLVSTLVLALMAAYALVFSWFGRNVVEQSRAAHHLSRQIGPHLSPLFRRLTNTHIYFDDGELCSEVYDCGKMQEYLDAQDHRRLAAYRTILFNDMFLAACVVGALMLFGLTLATEGALATLAAYIVALRYTVRSLGLLTAAATRVNRHFPRVSGYFEFISAAAANVDRYQPAGARPDRLDLLLSGARDGSDQCVKATVGDALAYISPLPLTRFTVRTMLAALAGGDSDLETRLRSEVFFCGPSEGYLPGTLRTNLLGRDSSNGRTERFARLVDVLGLGHAIGKKADNLLDAELTRDKWLALDEDVRFSVGLIPGLMDDRRLFLVDGHSFAATSAEFRARALEALSDRLLILTYTKAVAADPAVRIRGAALADTSRIVAVGSADWYEQNREWIARELESLLGRQQRIREGELVGSEEEMDMDFLDAA